MKIKGKRVVFRRLFLTLLFFGAMLVMAPSFTYAASLKDLANSAQNMQKNAIFGYNEFPSHNFDALPQWQNILRDFKETRPIMGACLKNHGSCPSDALLSLREIILRNKEADRHTQLRAINSFFNRWPYQDDFETYGLYEYWAPPFEFMRRSGDCEDYAIAKFFALHFLGFTNDEMRLVTVYDNIRLIGHSVLAIYMDGKILILDSLADGIFEHTLYRHYIPQYSLNENTRWLHTAPLARPPFNR